MGNVLLDEALNRRAKLNSEWHARPTARLQAPLRCSHQVYRRPAHADTRTAFAQLCTDLGQPAPASDSRHHVVQLASAIVKWEGHTEADSVTCLMAGNGRPLFSEPAHTGAPANLEGLFGKDLYCGVKVEVITGEVNTPQSSEIRDILGSDSILGGQVADGGASLWTTLQLDPDGHTRILVINHHLPEVPLSELLQRILEVESYRLQAIAALPLAREMMFGLSQLERDIEPMMLALTQSDQHAEYPELLTKLSNMAAKIEHLAADSSYRFAAARAYSQIVEQRLTDLREDLSVTQSRYSVFVLKSLLPAMRTCEAAERRIDELAKRVSRAINLLNSMVDMIQTRQTHDMLETMNRNSQMQIRLQQAVEGFSIFVISYYAIGLAHYSLEALAQLGYGVDPTLITGIAAPVVLALVWLNVRWLRRKLSKETP
jgi:uncharacterized membrane-anchored protein